jgi:hypothetical protein
MMATLGKPLAVKEKAMVTVILETEEVDVPEWVADLVSFRRWLDSDDVWDKARICLLKGRVWMDMSKEQIFTHVAVKTEITIVLGGLVKLERNGRFLQDGALLVNVDANIACKPDGIFITTAGLQDRVRSIESRKGGYVELEGSPDMVLEVISDGSVKKDTRLLRQAYWEAGIAEYWLVDARADPLSFEILRSSAKGYVATRKQDGWTKSIVFGKSFKLTRGRDVLGDPEFTLEVR